MKDWNKELDYLQSTRQKMWNDDYFEFLVRQVWKINRPVSILDFGCGYGDLGLRLLPLVPYGSSYTGVDIADELINKGRDIFKTSKYVTRFEVADLLQYEPIEKYDVVICQSVLRHIHKTKEVLKKMVASAKKDGLLICIEPSRRMENAGLYIDAPGYDVFENDQFLKQKWLTEAETGGRDFLIGMKIPDYMIELGLKKVDVRVNDYAEYISRHNNEKYMERTKSFIQNYGVNEKYYDEDYYFSARCHLISYGEKC
ncbi:class I SAM-dependent methyltransferase [Butyrivibrio sp. WCE2006]|uniref:class I SAM-dependent methyltransferase n=1 Tax=Butyrivibrio sp. WCE2006 TaxID=1410611 RepID=UPI000679A977|nr:class I SAM-dependent methyltransferase [Butyrivibrio sp. WCE2006]